jgi:hypothetical protein
MDSGTIGGLRPTAVKNEMGARFATPPAEAVLTHPMARGRMLPISSLYELAASSVAESMTNATSHRDGDGPRGQHAGTRAPGTALLSQP